MLRKIRIILAVIFILGITLLFLDFTGALYVWLGWMAKIQFLPALLAMNVVVVVALIVLTLVFGRIYCSVICPLGIFQDIVAWIHNHRKKNRYTYSPAKSILRYIVLVVFVVTFILGIHVFVSLLAPYSSYGRIVTVLLQPVYQLANNGLASLAEHFDNYTFYSVDIWMKGLSTLITALVTLVFLFVFSWYNGRTYCNTICPVGTVLSFLARFSWFKVHIYADKCIECGLCTKNCKASCIDFKNHKIDYSRCVVCGDCIGKCSTKSILYVHSKDRIVTEEIKLMKEVKEKSKPQISSARRSFLIVTALASSSVITAKTKGKVDGGLAVIKNRVAPKRNTKILPPGSLSVQHMTRYCTACQLCVSECPNEVLKPSIDLEHFMQPTISYERGACRPECVRCSDVCPTGAIHSITRAEKSSIQIGHAVWIKKNCVVLTDQVSCGNCARHCPVGAITMALSEVLDSNSPRVPIIPIINEERCIGCGSCEAVCPARPFAAIYVEGHEVHRTI